MKSLEKIENLRTLTLKSLNIARLPKFEKLPSLETLTLRSLPNLKSLDSLANLDAPHLKSITIEDCDAIESTAVIDSIKSNQPISYP